ncbi:MAG: DUF4012 domain-containing protein [Flavobacteriaceae bacterium]|nr:DUF4012 domain-containing protein [Flavobacteriaceae bacterium]
MNLFARTRFNEDNCGLRGRLTALPSGVRWGALVAAVTAVVFVGWFAVEGFTAKSNLEKAQSDATQAKDALLNGNAADATRFAERAQLHAHRASSASHSLPWNLFAALPLAGSPLKTAQQISDVVVGLADEILVPGVKMSAGLSPDKLIDGTRINLQLLRDKWHNLNELSTAATELDAKASTIPKPAYLSLISGARSQLQDQTYRLAKTLRAAAIAAELAPSMLGAESPRYYLLAIQNNAEARGTGGLLGGFAILRFDNGTPTVDMVAPNTELDKAFAVVDLGPEFTKVYGWANPLSDFRNSNLSPHFPYAAQIWKSMWEEQSGMLVDGVIAVDPVTLSYILGAIGPVVLPDGEVVNSDNVVELTQSIAYSRFAPVARAPEGMSSEESERYNKAYAAALRKLYLQNIAIAVVKKMTGPLPSSQKLLDALGRAINDGRISIWSANPKDQKLLEETPLGHAVPDDDGPYAQIVINNLAGNKMDYYLTRDIEYAADGCDGDMRNSTITVRLTNVADADATLPEYVAGSSGLSTEIPLRVPDGTMVTSVRLIATKGAKLRSVTSDGQRTPAIVNTERGHPSFEVQVAIPPGHSGELSFQLSEPTAAGRARVPLQPLIDNLTPKILVPTCSP